MGEVTPKYKGPPSEETIFKPLENTRRLGIRVGGRLRVAVSLLEEVALGSAEEGLGVIRRIVGVSYSETKLNYYTILKQVLSGDSLASAIAKSFFTPDNDNIKVTDAGTVFSKKLLLLFTPDAFNTKSQTPV